MQSLGFYFQLMEWRMDLPMCPVRVYVYERIHGVSDVLFSTARPGMYLGSEDTSQT